MCLEVKLPRSITSQAAKQYQKQRREKKALKNKLFKLSINNLVRTSTKDIKVVKRLSIINEKLVTLPRFYPVPKNKTLRARRFSFRPNIYSFFYLDVNKGIHSLIAPDFNRSSDDWYHATIPAGTKYIIGNNNNIVSLALVIGEPLTKKELKDAMAKGKHK